MNGGRNGQEGTDPGELADRQRELRERLNDMQNGKMPGDGSAKGEEGRERLGEAERAMREAYGVTGAPLWTRRWRRFFMATAGLFGHADGTVWGVGHYRLKPSGSAK